MTLEKLQVIIEAYTKPYRDELDKVKQQTTVATGHVERQTAKMRNSFKKIAGIMAAVFSITALVAFGRSCIKLGSDLQEVQNVVDVTFGDMSRQVDAFAKNAIKQFGLSELTAKKYMGTYGAMAKSFGIVGEAGYQMSAAITGLTGDVASFYNLSTDEAYTKLKSIFTGETESLKELGVVMTQTALDQYALNNGFGKTTAKMTEQEKVMLRYQFVMSQLSDASGDFARTSGSWANQVRVLQLQFESLKATIGQGLINAFTPVIRVINTILAKLQTLANYFKAFTSAIFGDANSSDSISGAADSMASAAGSSGAVADNMGKAAGAAKKMKEYTLGIDELNVLSPESEEGGSGGGGGGGGAAPDFGDFSGTLFGDVTVNPEIEAATERIKAAVERLKIAAKPTTDALKRLWNEGLSLLGNFTWTALGDFWNHFLVPLGGWTLGEGFPRFLDTTNELLKAIHWERLNASLQDLWKALEPFAENVGDGLLWFYDHILRPLAEYTMNYAVINLLDALTDTIEGLNYYIEKVRPVFDWLSDKLDWLKEFLDSAPVIKEWISDSALENLFNSVGAFESLKKFTDALNTLQGLETWFREKILPYLDKETWSDIGKNIIFGITAGFMLGIYSLIPDPVKELFLFFVKMICALFGIASPAKEMEPYGNNILLGIITGFRDTFGEWTKSLNEWYERHIAPWFTAQKWSELYSTIKRELENIWNSAVEWWHNNVTYWWNQHVSPWFKASRWKELYESIKSQLRQKWNETVGEWWSNLTIWWTEKVAPWFTVERWMLLYESIKTQLKQTWDKTVGQWATDIGSWWNNHVAVWFTLEKWLGLYETIKTQLKQTWDKTAGQWIEDIERWWKEDVSAWFTADKWKEMMGKIPSVFSDIFKGAVNAARVQLNKLIDWLNKKLHIEFEGLEIFGEEIIPPLNVQLFTIPHIPEFASGGIVNSGQLFIANEAGPEIVGKYGSKTGVMNNEQIVDAVSEGVAVAVANVMTAFSGTSQSDRPIELTVNLDGRTMSKTIYKADRRGGYKFRPV